MATRDTSNHGSNGHEDDNPSHRLLNELAASVVKEHGIEHDAAETLFRNAALDIGPSGTFDEMFALAANRLGVALTSVRSCMST